MYKLIDLIDCGVSLLCEILCPILIELMPNIGFASNAKLHAQYWIYCYNIGPMKHDLVLKF